MERGGASRPTSFYSQTTDSCCSVTDGKVEIRNLMDSFISDVQRIRDTFGDVPSGADGAASPAHSDPDVEMAQPVPGAYSADPAPPLQEYEHKGIWCDSCSQKVVGIRHKCLDCYNFDLCNPCMTTKDIQSTHADMPHTFEAIHPPETKPAPSKSRAQTSGSKPPGATSTLCLCSVLPRSTGCHICKSRGAAKKNENPEPALSYQCDSCRKDIAGTRHRCMICPDFDLCESCYTAGFPISDHSPVHRFMHIEHPIRIITAPAMSSDSALPFSAGCAHQGSRYKCENCGAMDVCMRCLGDVEGAIVRHAALHATQGWDKPVRFVPYTKGPSTQASVAPSPSVSAVHSANCDACDKTIVGIRHKCTVCHDFDLCDSCFDSGAEPLDHKSEHGMLHLDRPQRIVTHVVAPGNGTGSARPVSISSTGVAVTGALHHAWCDGCTERIRGVRHKCLDCEDFDLCDSCLGREHFGGAHEFYALVEPGEVVVRNVPQPPANPAVSEPSARARGIANARVGVVPTPSIPVPLVPQVPTPPAPQMLPPSRHQPRPARPSAAPASHSAACDMCSSRIHGVRYKCAVCPDYDMCENCFRVSEEVHPGHSFAKVYERGDVVVRKSAQSSFRHHARCDVCQNQIIGIRYKCIHPSCPDFDICGRCEAMPFPVHPETHPYVKLRSHISNYDGLKTVFSFAADRSQVSQPQSSTLRVPSPIVRIPSPRVQIPSPLMARSPISGLVEPITSNEVFHTATPSPVVPLSTLGCTIVPHSTIVASLPHSPAPEPIRLSPRLVSPLVIPSASTPRAPSPLPIPSPPPIPASLLSQTYSPERLTDSWSAASSSAKLDEHKMHHSNMYKPSYEAPPVVPRAVVEEPKPVATLDEEARMRRLSALESPEPASPVRGVTVQEEHDPEAPQMILVNAHPVSVREPLAVPASVVAPVLVQPPIVIPVPVAAPTPIVIPAPIPVAAPEPVEASLSDLPPLLSAYPYRPATPSSQTLVPTVVSLSGTPSLASSVSVLSFDASTLDAAFVEDRNIVDGQIVSGGAEFAKCWRMRNTGSSAWPKGTTISLVGGDNMLMDPHMIHWAVSGDLSPGQFIDVEVDMKAPEEPGHYLSHWRLKTPEGEAFGARVWCDITVAEMERAGSSGSSEVAASSIIVPHAPGMSAASFTSSVPASPTIHSVHSVPSTFHTGSIADTADIESISSEDSEESDDPDMAIWEEVRRRQSGLGAAVGVTVASTAAGSVARSDAGAARSDADAAGSEYEMIYDSEA